MSTRKPKEEQMPMQVFNFSGVSVPQPTETIPASENVYVPWGLGNDYPYFLLDLYATSPTHASIINSKADYIMGDGVKLKGGKAANLKINPADTLNEFMGKVVKDYLIYNCLAVEVIYNNFNLPIQFIHVPMHKLRVNKTKTKFWFSDDWRKSKANHSFDRWTKESGDNKSKVYFFDGYSPTYNQTYAVPEYIGAVKSMMLEAKVQTYNLNNVEHHFSPSTIVTMHQGANISDEQKRLTLKLLKDSYTGAAGNKMIIDFQDRDGKPASVQTIEQPNADTYLNTNKDAQDKILIAHQVTSPMLFGVKTEGQLGGATEMETAFEIFKNKYIANKRADLENAMNILFASFDALKGGIEFSDRPLFNTQLDSATKEKVMTINELRAEAGLPALPDGDRMVGFQPAAQPAVQPVSQPEENKFTTQLIELTEADYEKIADMGSIRDDYEFYGDNGFVFSAEDMNSVELKFETAQEIADYILEKKIKNLSIAELKALIRKDLGINVSQSELQGHLDAINKSGLLNIETTDGEINVKPASPEQSTRKVEVMYAYELREGVKGEPIIETTRPFCRRLINNNKVYTRAEIQRMSQIFQYDVFELGGGYYMNPETGKATEFCRHRFKAYSVARRTRS